MNVDDFTNKTVEFVCNTLKRLPIHYTYIGFVLNVLHCLFIIVNIVLLFILSTRAQLHYLIIVNLCLLLTHILFKKCLLIKIEQCFTHNIVIDKMFNSFVEYFNIPNDNKCSSHNSILVIIHAMLVLIKYVYSK